jgi:hypothetical protein
VVRMPLLILFNLMGWNAKVALADEQMMKLSAAIPHAKVHEQQLGVLKLLLVLIDSSGLLFLP